MAIVVIGGVLILAGCQPLKPAATQPTTQATPGREPPRLQPVLHTVLSSDARPLVYRLITKDDPPLDPEAYVMVQLDVYDIASPAGSISSDVSFAELIEGDSGSQTLLSNGIRVGMASQDRWDAFKKIFELHPVKTTPTTIIGTSGRAELLVQKEIASQTIFHLDAHGQLIGRSFDSSDNFWAARFNPVPHQAGLTQVSLTPAVRAVRKRLEVSRASSEVQINFVQPESLYDVTVHTQIERGKFLVIWPTVEAVRQSTSLASAFLVSHDEGHRLEHIFILSPRLYLFDEAETRKLEQRKQGTGTASDGSAGAVTGAPRP